MPHVSDAKRGSRIPDSLNSNLQIIVQLVRQDTILLNPALAINGFAMGLPAVTSFKLVVQVIEEISPTTLNVNISTLNKNILIRYNRRGHFLPFMSFMLS